MAWFDRFLDSAMTRLGYAKAKDLHTLPVLAGETPRYESDWEGFSTQQREQLAITSAWVYSDIRAIANEVANAAFMVKQRQGEDWIDIPEHPFEQLWATPNRNMSSQWLIQYTVWWLLLRGEAYLLKAYQRAGELAELWPAPASRMAPIPDAQNYIGGFKYLPSDGQQPVRLETRQVVFMRLPNPFDYHRGLSPLSAYRMALETDMAASKWNRDAFTNEVTLRTLLSMPQETAPTTFTACKAEIEDQLVTAKKRYIIARAGDLDVKQLSMSQKDAEYLAGREFTREEIDRVFGVPAGYWAKEATRANTEAARATLIEQAVWPLLKLIAGDLTSQLIALDYGQDFRGVFEDVRVRDRSLQVQERQAYWQVQTVNEARAELGLSPLETGVEGEMLVPLATKCQPMLGGAPQVVSSEAQAKAIKDELSKWESVVRRRLKRGEPAAYDFESDVLPAVMKAAVLSALQNVQTDEEARAAFAALFQPPGWEGYP